jgi:hypothetical protein
MNRISLRAAVLASCMAALLAGCGGGGGDDGGGSTTTTNANTGGLPSSATSSVEGLIAYMKGLIATNTDSTSEPVSLGNAVLPTSDTTEPIRLN